jgi:cytochrome c peroxidase
MKALFSLLPASLLAVLLLSACGGGGGDTSTSTSTSLAEADVTALLATLTQDPLEVAIVKLAPANPTRRQALGQLIFNDANLSEPRGTACVNCHRPNMGFAGNNRSGVGVPLGSLGQLGLRNAMTNAYSGFIPAFGFKTEDGNTEAVGGHFWDGRADTLALQALGPFLNPKEMNNASAKVVMDKIAVSSYANLFRQEFGANVFANADTAYTQVGVAIEAFERADRLQSFTSKYDAFVRGQVKLAPAEQRGMALFTDASKGNCAACHLMNPASGKPQDSLFSEFTYYATGIPRNAAIPSNSDASFFDLGLCGPNRAKPVLPSTVPATVSVESFCGMFRMPTLRNVAERPAFMHNGVFKDLRQVVSFYATRNSNPERWYGPTGAPNDLPTAYLGNIEKTKAPFNRTRADGPALTAAEVNDVVAFLGTLSDGFSP